MYVMAVSDRNSEESFETFHARIPPSNLQLQVSSAFVLQKIIR